jgi:serine/threonine protein kinase
VSVRAFLPDQESAVAFELGKTYGDYEIIDVESSSRAGVAYRVRNLTLNRIELMRVLSKPGESGPDQEERFLREAGVRARLDHPNIETFYGARLLEGQFVILTELLEGVTLEQRLELGPLPVQEALALAWRALAALGNAHEAGIVHRDVRPANLILASDGQIKLTGFALAKGASDATLTQMGTCLGEVHYMPPEQIRGLSSPDARSDFYSLGVVLFESLTARKPFDSRSQFEVMMAHVNSPPPAVSALCPAAPPWLDQAIQRAMAKDPAQRFDNAASFEAALREPASAPIHQPPVAQPIPAAPEPGSAPASKPLAPLQAQSPVTAPAAPATPRHRHPAPMQTPVALRKPSLSAPGPAIRKAAAPAPTPANQLPDAGFPLRDVVLLSLGLLVMVASAFLVATS